MRRALVPVLLVLTGLFLFVGGLALWVENTVYDSNAFSRRVTSALDSAAVRREVAERLTVELVRSGNQQAINFRPAYQQAIETALDTDAFRSIIRNAIRTLHADLLQGGSGSAGINLSDSISIITGTLQLPTSARGEPIAEGGFASTFADISQRMADLGIWELRRTLTIVGAIALLAAVAAAIGAIVLSRDRRRTAWWLGWTLAIVGLAAVIVLWIGQWYAGTRFGDPELSAAISGGVSDVTIDLRTLALWTIGYGVVIAGAAASTDRSLTPAVVGRRVNQWLDARRQSTGGTLVIGILGVVIGLLIIQNLAEASIALAVVAGLWLTYLGTAELARLLRRVAEEPATRTMWWRPVAVVGVVVLLLGGLVAALAITTTRSADDAVAAVDVGCNGDEALCDRRLDEVIFAGTHNAMSSALYPGWLLGEQIGSVGDQLNSGIRALLLDSHYGIPSTVRLPGSQTPIVLTDRARELTNPEFEQADQAVVERANALAARAPSAASRDSSIYLCHNYCELGAVSFASVLGDVKDFVDTHPNDVVIMVVQDATTPDETAQVFIDAGLEDSIATLELGQPLPTLQELIDAGTTLIVFAEDGGATSGPDWYQPAYQGWVQETPFNWTSIEEFDCPDNRGGTEGELFLINHWVATRATDPAIAAQANADDVIRQRVDRCIEERGVIPNIIAVNFAQASQLVALVAELNQTILDDVPDEPAPSTTGASSTTAPPETTAAPSTTAPTTAEPLEDVTLVTALTGGDPGAFCSTISPVLSSVTAYAEAVLSQSPDQAGRTDLAFGPLLVRELTPYLDAAPQELFELADPLRQRAQQAVDALTQLGLDATAQSALADQGSEALVSTPPTDGATLQVDLLATIGETVAPDDLDAAAAQLTEANPDPATQLDLGFVPSAVAEANGYSCNDGS